jgi:hypothetical protein
MSKITLNSPWTDLTTRESWTTWLEIALVKSPDTYDWWHTDEGCHDCIHFDAGATWCKLVELPASRNPVLNMLGMACCGMGYDNGNPQTDLFDNDPF